ncbi:hypothetical protein P353_18570 [Comamonas testosteroni]|uniref:Uncharacterized protein n=1 Tax=Comamonas testosteroni TaxID=285 RepID=A0A096FA86_COMTE|nr:hypothetical protein P353_18570 [Comamonas testosteroni]
MLNLQVSLGSTEFEYFDRSIASLVFALTEEHDLFL